MSALNELAPAIDPTLELNVWRQLNFSNGPCFGLLKSVHHRLCSNPVFADARSRVCWVVRHAEPQDKLNRKE